MREVHAECVIFFFFSSRRRHTRSLRDWSSDVCSSDLPPRILTVTREGRTRSAASVEEARKENDDEAVADTSGRPCYGRGEKAGGAQVVESGKEECMGSSGIGEVHVDMILRCRRESWSRGKVVVGHFCYGHRSLESRVSGFSGRSRTRKQKL